MAGTQWPVQQTMESLRDQTANLRSPVAPIVVEQRRAGQPGVANTTGPRTYTVKAGDTLSRISREMYGSAGRWAEIFQANRDQLPSQNALRPGQVLRIP